MCTKHTFAWWNVLLCFQMPLCVCSYSWPHDLVARAGSYESADNNSCTSSTTASSYDIGKSLGGGGVEVTVVQQLSYWSTKPSTSYFCFTLCFTKRYSEYLYIYEYLPMLCGLYHNVLVVDAHLSRCVACSAFLKQKYSVAEVRQRSHGSCHSCPTWSKGNGVS